MKKFACALSFCASLWIFWAEGTQASDPFLESFAITPPVQAALDSISANSLKGHLSFVASDLLEGRDSPSRGLDIAAEYIAAQFRRAGLEPGGDDGYFQTAPWFLAQQDGGEFRLELEVNGKKLQAKPDEVSFRVKSKLELSAAGVFKLPYTVPLPETLGASDIKDRVVVTEMPDVMQQDQSQWEELFRKQRTFLQKLEELNAALVISVDRNGDKGDGAGPGSLVDPEQREASSQKSLLRIRVYGSDWIKAHDDLSDGWNSASVALRIPGPVEKPVKLKNVIGVLRGSDPVLRETCVIVTAHYDHVGVKPPGTGDRIYNGANDDGSGTVSVIELASALARLDIKPKRSLVFMTVFGEEKGLMGSSYYARHPLFPIEKTVANINLEVVGRTDTGNTIEKNRASVTGFDYSTVGSVLKRAGDLIGLDVYRHERFSDVFFDRSDNRAFAAEGVPAHSVCAVFMYPDYHSVRDEWEKIDYPNLERIVRTVALGLVMLADNPAEPRWNEDNPKATRYLEAWKKRRKALAAN